MCSFFYILDLNLSFGKQWKACKERKTLSIRQSGIVSSKGIHKQSVILYIVWFTRKVSYLNSNIGGIVRRWLRNQKWLDDWGTFYLNCLNSKVGWKLRRWLKNQIWPGEVLFELFEFSLRGISHPRGIISGSSRIKRKGKDLLKQHFIISKIKLIKL